MKKTNYQYLSYLLNTQTPTYGNRNKFACDKKSDILKGDVANDSSIDTTVHIGTHIDMPYHFFEDGQTIEDFDADYFVFKNVLILDFIPENIILNEELIEKLEAITDKESYDILIVKTSICYQRGSESYWKSNYGFAPEVANYLRERFVNVHIIGFDSISVSSFENRMLGREAHKAFLNPANPILLLEDMDLRNINVQTKFKSLVISPLRIEKCDGLPCTVLAEIDND